MEKMGEGAAKGASTHPMSGHVDGFEDHVGVQYKECGVGWYDERCSTLIPEGVSDC